MAASATGRDRKEDEGGGREQKGEKPWKIGGLRPNTTWDVKYMGMVSIVSLWGRLSCSKSSFAAEMEGGILMIAQKSP